MAETTAPDDDIRRLYRLPPEEFTASRNALVKELRKAKQGEEAKEVQALARPSPSAWAVTALFEREPAKMKELVAAGERARAAQREAVSGRGAAALRESLEKARGLSDELRWEAGRILAETGRPPSREVLERISASLQALAFSPSTAEVAARGWLDRDLEPPGFEVLAGLAVSSAPVVDFEARRQARRKEQETEEKAPERKGKRGAGRDEEEQQQKDEEARRRQEAAEAARREREAEERRRRIAAAREKVARQKEEADRLAKEALRAEGAAEEARQQAETAERAAGRAREKAETAAHRLEIAREQLREAEGG